MTNRNSPQDTQRDWVTIGLVICIIYLTMLLPFATLIGGKPEIVGAAIGALTTALLGVITVRAVRK